MIQKEKIRQVMFERIELFFIANGVTDEANKKAMLLSCYGIATYRIFRGTTAPKNLQTNILVN